MAEQRGGGALEKALTLGAALGRDFDAGEPVLVALFVTLAIACVSLL